MDNVERACVGGDAEGGFGRVSQRGGARAEAGLRELSWAGQAEGKIPRGYAGSRLVERRGRELVAGDVRCDREWRDAAGGC